MRLLLDTDVAIWATTTPQRIPDKVRAAIEDTGNWLSVSAAAVWEIASKHQFGRADAPPLSGHQAIAEFEAAGFDLLDVKLAHAAFVEHLPLHHSDPLTG